MDLAENIYIKKRHAESRISMLLYSQTAASRIFYLYLLNDASLLFR